MADSKVMSLKLLIDKKEKRVLFAEAGKDFVDFLFSILSLPLGTITSLLAKQPSMIGSLRNLYNSIENLSEQYIQPNQHKSTFLKPKLPVSALPVPLLSLDPPPAGCSNCSNRNYVAGDASTVCPNCRRSVCSKCRSKMSRESLSFGPTTYSSTNLFSSSAFSSSTPASFSSSAFSSSTPASLFGSTPAPFSSSTPAPAVKEVRKEGGLVKGGVAYMVMDDLGVTPMSTISSITLLNKFNIGDLSVLQEKVVHLGVDEALKLLKVSLESKTVLTSVFLEA
ncbi:hypothetical protein LguiA_035003 [Lonicera macranthoides]